MGDLGRVGNVLTEAYKGVRCRHFEFILSDSLSGRSTADVPPCHRPGESIDIYPWARSSVCMTPLKTAGKWSWRWLCAETQQLYDRRGCKHVPHVNHLLGQSGASNNLSVAWQPLAVINNKQVKHLLWQSACAPSRPLFLSCSSTECGRVGSSQTRVLHLL